MRCSRNTNEKTEKSAYQADPWRLQDIRWTVNCSQPKAHQTQLTEPSTQDRVRPSIDGPGSESIVPATSSAVTRLIVTQELPASLQQTALRTKWSLKPATATQLQITHGANGHNTTSHQMQGISGLLQCQCSCRLSGGESVRSQNNS